MALSDPVTLIRSGAALCVLGVIAAMVADPAPGGLAVLTGIVICALGLHRLGRSGYDAPLESAGPN